MKPEIKNASSFCLLFGGQKRIAQRSKRTASTKSKSHGNAKHIGTTCYI